jgi:hypothetical protein
MKEAQDEFGAKAEGKFGDELGSRALYAGDMRVRSEGSVFWCAYGCF